MGKKKRDAGLVHAGPSDAVEIAYLQMPSTDGGSFTRESFSPALAIDWLRFDLPQWITLCAVGATNAKDEDTRLLFEELAHEVAKVARALAEVVQEEEPVEIVVSDDQAAPEERRAALARMVGVFLLGEDPVDSIEDHVGAMARELVRLCDASKAQAVAAA